MNLIILSSGTLITLSQCVFVKVQPVAEVDRGKAMGLLLKTQRIFLTIVLNKNKRCINYKISYT